MKKFSKYNTTILIRPQSGMCYNAVYDKFVFMKKYLIICLMLLSPLFILAKTSVGNKTIKGVVADTEGKPIEGAVV